MEESAAVLFLQLLTDGFATGCAVGVVAITFAYVYTTTGIFHVAHAGIYTFSAYIAWYLTNLGTPFIAATAVAVILSAAVGVMIQRAIYQPLAERGASPLVMLIASLGLLAVLQNVVAIAFSPNILQFSSAWRLQTVDLGGVILSYPQLAIIATSLGILGGLLWFSSKTILGRRIGAVASNPQLAQIARLKPKRVFVIVLAIASGLVAVPSILTGVDQAIQPYTSILMLLTAVIAVIAGGIGSMPGAFIISIVISMIQTIVLIYVPGKWSISLTYAVFIVFILLMPTGMFRTRVQRAS
jgi:branched-chain amino acid transport system permease protein